MKEKQLLTLMITLTLATGISTTTAWASPITKIPSDGIIVTATRSTKQIQSVPSSVSVVTQKDIEEHHFKSVPEALQYLPGVYMEQHALGSVHVRGFDAADVLVMVDGMPMSSTFNNYVEWELIPITNVKRIELVRGASSSLYGGHAVGAVINIITKAEADKTRGDLMVGVGSHNQKTLNFHYSFVPNDTINFDFDYNHRSTDGFSGYYYKVAPKSNRIHNKIQKGERIDTLPEKDKHGAYLVGMRGPKHNEGTNYAFQANYYIDDSKFISYRLAHNEATYSYGAPKTYLFKNNQPIYNGNIYFDKSHNLDVQLDRFLGYEGIKKSTINQLRYEDEDHKIVGSFGILNMTANGFSSPKGAKTLEYNGPGIYSSYPGKTIHLDFQKAWPKLKGGRHTLLLGMTYLRESFDQHRYQLAHWRDVNSIDRSTYNKGVREHFAGVGRDWAFFGQDEYKLNDRTTIYGGLRLDMYKKSDGIAQIYDTTGHFHKVKRDGKEIDQNFTYGATSYTELSPKISLNYKANKDLHYYVSYGHSFNPPPLYKVYRYGVSFRGYEILANPDLKPERSNTFEVGLSKKWGKDTSLSLNYYNVHTDNKIVMTAYYKKGSSHIDYKRYENRSSESREGLELGVEHKFSPTLTGYANYSWQQGHLSQEAVTATNLKEISMADYGIPRNIFHGGITYKKAKWLHNIDVQYVSGSRGIDDATGGYTYHDPYFLVNWASNYKATKDLSFQLAINNLFDRHFDDDEAVDGRNFNVSLRYRF